MDIEMMIEDAGHCVIAEADSLYSVQALGEESEPHLALVDIQLADGTNGLDVSRHLCARWPNAIIIFLTANPLVIPIDYAGAHGVISKPFSRNGLSSALRYLEEAVTAPPPVSLPPANFVAADALEKTWA